VPTSRGSQPEADPPLAESPSVPTEGKND